MVQMQMTLAVENIGGPIVGESLNIEVDYEWEEGNDSLQFEIPAADEVQHEFTLTVPPGAIRVDIEIEGQSFPFDRVAKSADLQILQVSYEAISDGQIALEVTVQNSGTADAEDVIVVGSVTHDDFDAAGEGRAQVIPPGEDRIISVPISIPAGEYAIKIEASTASLEAYVEDNLDVLPAIVVYVDIGYDYTFETGGYWSDGTANVNVSVTALNSGVGAFTDTAEVSYTCAGAGIGDEVSTGKFEFVLPNGIAPVTESITLRSSPGTVECRFISAEQGTENADHEIPAKIVGVSREVWECYSDQTINRHGDIGCAAWMDETVVKWDSSDPISYWVTGDPKYVEFFESTLNRLAPILGMTFENALDEESADVKAWVGMRPEDAPSRLSSGNCVDAGGCASRRSDGSGTVTDAWIGVWTVDTDWVTRTGLVDRLIEHISLHELLHALAPFRHRDDPLSAVNNINAPDWLELDPLEEALIRLNNNPLVEPGMTMIEVRELVVLRDEVIDGNTAFAEVKPTGLEMLKQAYSDLQNANSARWRLEGGWQGGGCDFSFGRATFTAANFGVWSGEIWSFISGSDRIYSLDRGDEQWSREGGEWVKDDPELWEGTDWREGFSSVHQLLVDALYFADEQDIRSSTVIDGEITLRFLLTRSTNKPTWVRSSELRGEVTLDNRTNVIIRYKMDWLFDVIGDSCDRYVIRGTEGQYNVPFEVPDEVYEGTTGYNRSIIDLFQ